MSSRLRTMMEGLIYYTCFIFLQFLFKSIRSSPEFSKSTQINKKSGDIYTLKNGLQVCLIHEPNSVNSGASVSVGVGSGSDPEDLPGLAHFVEHSLFLGTLKYPKEGEVADFITANGGSFRAITYLDETVYILNVASTALPEALLRFGDMFVSPIFRESSLRKEIEAIQSEYEINSQDDDRILEAVERATSNKRHPLSRNNGGNRETLWTIPISKAKNMSEELLHFFQKYYRAENMRLVVQGPQHLEELRHLIESSFYQVKSGHVDIPISNEPPYGPNELKRWIFVVPRTEIDQVVISFALPVTYAEWITEVEYISSLITQTSTGSFRDVLRTHLLARDVESYFKRNRNFYMIHITLEMNKQGIELKETVVGMFYCYLNLLRRTGFREAYWTEYKLLQNISSHYKQETDLQDSLKKISSTMLLSNITTWNDLQSDVAVFNLSSYKRILSMITPANMRVTIISKECKNESKQTEEISRLKYGTRKFKRQTVREWKRHLNCSQIRDEIQFPSSSPYVPKNFDIKPPESHENLVPRVIKETNMSKIWFLQDTEFFTPRAIVSLDVLNPKASGDPLSYLLTSILSSHEHLVLDEDFYIPNTLDFSYSVEPTYSGLRLQISCYDDTLPQIFNKIVKSLLKWNIFRTEDRWIRSVRNLRRELYADENIAVWQPSKYASNLVEIILTENMYTYDELYSAIDDVTLERLARHQMMLFSRMKLQWVFYGNLLSSEVLEIAHGLENFWSKTWKPRPLHSYEDSSGQIEIPEGSNWLYEVNTSHSHNAIVLLYQLQKREDKRDHACVILLEQIISDSFFDQIRTQENLGYVALINVETQNPAPDVSFVVQSSQHPAFIYSRVQRFLMSFSEKLDKLGNREFQKHKMTFMSVLKMHQPKNQLERFNRLFDYDNERKYTDAIDKLTLESFKEFFRNSFLENGIFTKTLLVTVTSRAKGGSGSDETKQDISLLKKMKSSRQIIQDVFEWKEEQNVFLKA